MEWLLRNRVHVDGVKFLASMPRLYESQSNMQDPVCSCSSKAIRGLVRKSTAFSRFTSI